MVIIEANERLDIVSKANDRWMVIPQVNEWFDGDL
jgi:hypothetical protein